MSAPIIFDYSFRFEEDPGHPIQFRVELDPITLDHARREVAPLPPWTERGEDLCGDCPGLCNETHCPLAVSIAEVAAVFADHMSYSRVVLEVTGLQRAYRAETTLQKALGSLIGLYMATSGCPVMAPFKSMARFHMPVASRDETVFRAVGSYLIGQYLRAQRGEAADLSLEGLQACYAKVHGVNKALAARLRDRDPGDANINAIVVLDLMAHELPKTIREGLDEMLHMYGHLFETGGEQQA